MKQYKINLYPTYSNLKGSICERFNRTLKNKMWMQFSLRGNFKWLDFLPDLITDCNNKKYRTIHMKPKNVTTANEAQVLKQYSSKPQPVKKKKFKVNDRVRVSRLKQVFEKGYIYLGDIHLIGQLRYLQ